MTRDALPEYPVFRYAAWWPKLNPPWCNVVVAVFSALVFIVGGWRDGTILLHLPDTGLLQHPGIWWFLVGQVWLPFVLRASVRRFQRLHDFADTPLTSTYIEKRYPKHLTYFSLWLRRQDNKARIAYAVLTAVGAVAWAWNTYSNQRPEAVGFDFWDSSRHTWGFAATRFYKAYIWFGLMPCIAHVQLGLISATRRLIRDASRHRGIVMEPFHADGSGGLSVFIETVLSPMVPTVFIASMISLSAVVVHKRYDVTTISGLTLACVVFVSLYLLPAGTLRNAIKREKRRQRRIIARIQQRLYGAVTTNLKSGVVPLPLAENVGAMMSLNSVSDQVRGLPEWPQMRSAFRFAILAWSSPAIVWVGEKGLEKLTALVSL